MGAVSDVIRPKVSQAELDSKFFRGLSDPTRVRIVEALLEGEKNVTELREQLRIPQSSCSMHLSCLRWCGYVSHRKNGRNIYYQVTDPRIREIIRLTRLVITDNAQAILTCDTM